MGLCSCSFPITKKYLSSGDKYLVESWLVKEGDQLRPLQSIAVVQGPLEKTPSEKLLSKTQPVCITTTEKTLPLELVTLSGSNLESFPRDFLQPPTSHNSPTNNTSTCSNYGQTTNYMGLRVAERVAGKVCSLLVRENEVVEPQQLVLTVDICDHKVQFNGNCAICGLELDIYSASPVDSPRDFSSIRNDWLSSTRHHLNPAYTHPQLRVSRNELELVEGENALRLLRRRKLSLVLDLDNTLIHATQVSHLVQDYWYPYKQEMQNNACSPLMMEDIHELDLDGSISLVKLRPNVRRFLENIQQTYELHIYTMGSRSYADAVAALLDPSGKLFQRRIVSRDDFAEGLMNRKSLSRIFPCDDSMVVIVDDREDVWLDHSQGEMVPNLIRARPYLFFISDTHENTNNNAVGCMVSSSSNDPSADEALISKESFVDSGTQWSFSCPQLEKEEDSAHDVHSWYPLPWIQKPVENDENYLYRLEQLLIEIHERFFQELDNSKVPLPIDESIKLPLQRTCDVKWILSEMRHRVLTNCYISFTGIFRLDDSPEMSSIWRLAEAFGATCSKKITSDTTHLIVDSQRGLHTGKTKYAMQRGDIFLVTLEWLETSVQFYLRASELQFALYPKSISCSNDLEKYRKSMEKRHEQVMQHGRLIQHSPQNSPTLSKPSKRRKIEYSSSEEDIVGTLQDYSSSQDNETKNNQHDYYYYHHPEERKTLSGCKEQQDHLEWTACYLACELEKELMNDPLPGGGDEK